jgi:hypothetical protein
MIKRNRRYMARQKGFDSAWEEELNRTVMRNGQFHVDKISYTIDHTYEPDWRFDNGTKTLYIEAKGRFMDMSEASKYKWVRKVLKSNEELVFLFQEPNKPMPHAKKRKDGTKQTHREWAERNDFRCFSVESIVTLLKDF